MYRVYKSWTSAKKTEVGGIKYDSKFEGGYAKELITRQKAGDITRFESHVQIPLNVNGYHICNYYIDFKVYHNDGTIEYVETKGYPTPVWKLKWKIFEALYSGDDNVQLTIVQQGKFKMPKAKKIKRL